MKYNKLNIEYLLSNDVINKWDIEITYKNLYLCNVMVPTYLLSVFKLFNTNMHHEKKYNMTIVLKQSK